MDFSPKSMKKASAYENGVTERWPALGTVLLAEKS